MATAKTALGAKLYAVAAGGTLAQIADVVSITPPKITRDTIDVTDLATTGGMEFIGAGVYDAGTISVQMHYIAGSTADTLFTAAMLSGAAYDFKIVVKSAAGTADISFAGIVTQYGADDLTVGGKQTASLTVKVSGDVAQAASA